MAANACSMPCVAVARSGMTARPSVNQAFKSGFQLRSISTRTTKVQALTAEISDLDVEKMAPLGDRLLIKPRPAEEKSAGGLILGAGAGAASMQDAIIGTVVATGDEVDCGVAAGDVVLYSKYGTSEVEGGDGNVTFVAQKSILAKLT